MAEIPLDLLKRIRRIQIQTNHLAADVLAGSYRSAFKGRGIEFEEVKDYQPGDDIRTIDWNVTARMNRPYVKSFREERELTVMLVVDISSSARFGSGQSLKSDLITEIGGLLAFSAIKNNDKVGLILFSDHVERYLPPRKGLRHVIRVIRELLVTPQRNKRTDISKALAFLGKVQRRSAVCFIISDFISPDYSRDMTLVSKKHDIIALSVTDPFEWAFPNINLANLCDLESGEMRIIDTSPQGTRESLHKAAEERRESIKGLMDKLGAGYIDIRTDRPYVNEIKKFFKLRGGRRR